MKRLAMIVVVSLMAFATAQTGPPVAKVGTLFSFTGALAEFGPAIYSGAELAAQQINDAATAVFGGPIIELVQEDSGTSPSVGVDRARKLVNTDNVVAIVGALSSGVTVAVAESVTIPSQVVLMSPASTSPLISALEDEDFVFRTVASDALQGVVGAQLARGEIVAGHSFDTASIIYVNNPYGQGLADAFEAAFERRGGRVLAKVAHPEEPQPTYASQLEQALAGNPDVLLAIGYPGQATVYLQESRDLYGFTSWQFVDGTKSQDIIDTLGGASLEGDYGTAPGSDPQWAGYQRFSGAYDAVYGKAPPLPFIDTTYDAVAVIGLAVAKAIVDGVEPTAANVRDRLREVANGPGETVGVGDFEEAFGLLKIGAAVDYTGAGGEVDFDAAGDVVTPVAVWRYAGATIETVDVRKADQIPTE